MLNQMKEMPVRWISSAQSHFCIHFRYKFSVYFELRADCLPDFQRDSKLN